MRTEFYAGIFVLAFLAVTGIMASLCLHQAWRDNANVSISEIIEGKWSVKFEHSLGEIIPIFNPSRHFWGRTEYQLFKQGRKGVVVGEEGWIFTDEEFSCPENFKENLAENKNYILRTKERMASKGTALAIAFIPAKSRVYADYLGKNSLPECRAALYEQTLKFIKASGISVVDLLTPMSAQKEVQPLFFKTDTHWTPQGAQLAAKHLAAALSVPGTEKTAFTTAQKGTKMHEGDLLRYLPGVDENIMPRDSVAIVETSPQSDENDLFSSGTPPVTLVGTSYSANPLWNFDGFLKQEMEFDILNMADEGLGPYTVMDKYIESSVWNETPPKLVIWEIPERYMLFPHDVNSNSGNVDHQKVF